MGIKQTRTYWHTPGGNRKEVLPLPNSRGRFKAKHSMQNVIGFALSWLLDPSPGDAVTTINLKKVFSTGREKCAVSLVRRLDAY